MAQQDDFDGSQIDDADPQAPKQLREALKRAGEKAAKVGTLEKEVAALRLGIDTSSRKGQAWLAGFEGDISDPEAMLNDAKDFDPSIVKAEVVAAGDGTGTGEPTAATTEPTGTQERTALADGSPAAATAKGDPRQEALDGARRAMKEGATFEKAAGAAIRAQAAAVIGGTLAALPADGRVPVDQ